MNVAVVSAQLLKTMVEADREQANALVTQTLEAGCTGEVLLREALEPALVAIGEQWVRQEASLAQTFIAAKIAEDTLRQCLPMEANEEHGVGKGPIVLGNIEDDFHSLGRRMVTTFLRASGWDVYDLGNDVPAEELLDRAVKEGAPLLGASAMMHTTALNIKRLRELIDQRGLADKVKLAVGGAVFNWRPELVGEVGGDGTATNAAEAPALMARLLAEVQGGAAT